jgi:hypothetical protein
MVTQKCLTPACWPPAHPARPFYPTRPLTITPALLIPLRRSRRSGKRLRIHPRAQREEERSALDRAPRAHSRRPGSTGRGGPRAGASRQELLGAGAAGTGQRRRRGVAEKAPCLTCRVARWLALVPSAGQRVIRRTQATAPGLGGTFAHGCRQEPRPKKPEFRWALRPPSSHSLVRADRTLQRAAQPARLALRANRHPCIPLHPKQASGGSVEDRSL